MSRRKTIRHKTSGASKTVKKRIAPKVNKQNSRTMQIPVDAIFEDTAPSQSLHINVAIPGKKDFTIPIDSDELTIGRDSHCAVHLPIDNVSREHARILCNGETLTVQDLESTNGTFVNNVKVVKCILHQTDQIQIGQARMTFIRTHGGQNS